MSNIDHECWPWTFAWYVYVRAGKREDYEAGRRVRRFHVSRRVFFERHCPSSAVFSVNASQSSRNQEQEPSANFQNSGPSMMDDCLFLLGSWGSYYWFARAEASHVPWKNAECRACRAPETPSKTTSAPSYCASCNWLTSPGNLASDRRTPFSYVSLNGVSYPILPDGIDLPWFNFI